MIFYLKIIQIYKFEADDYDHFQFFYYFKNIHLDWTTRIHA